MTFEDELAGEDILWNMLKDLEFGDNIEVDMQDVVKAFMLSGVLEAHADERYEKKRIELDEFRGELDEQAREFEVVQRPTDSKVKSWIDRNEEYVKRRKTLAKLARKLKILRHLNRAFQIKADLLRTKAANQRLQYNDLGMSPQTVSNRQKDAEE